MKDTVEGIVKKPIPEYPIQAFNMSLEILFSITRIFARALEAARQIKAVAGAERQITYYPVQDVAVANMDLTSLQAVKTTEYYSNNRCRY
jgi:hypothetical protein